MPTILNLTKVATSDSRGVKLTTHLQLVRQENVDLYIHSPICLHGVVLKQLGTGIILPFTCRIK
jgi:hypothetical protein